EVSFSRNGAFSVTNDRYVVDAAGRKLQLFPTTTDGSILTSELASTISARVPLTSGVPQATSGIKLAVNLPADAVVIPDKPIYSVANPYGFDPADPNTFNNSTSVTIFDSLGNPLAANIYYVKTGLPTVPDPTHKWLAHVIVGGQELNIAGAPGIPMQFDTAGTLTSPTTQVLFDTFTPATGGQPIALGIDHGVATTQQSGNFSRASIEQDGFPSGQLESVAVDGAGTLRASFTNGEVQTLGKVALAIFSNPQGLKQVGDASFVGTPDSGPAITGEGGRNGIGGVLSGSLERSNVDLTIELAPHPPECKQRNHTFTHRQQFEQVKVHAQPRQPRENRKHIELGGFTSTIVSKKYIAGTFRDTFCIQKFFFMVAGHLWRCAVEIISAEDAA
ncbi:MAG: flagellar hook-basal body complex protein, partial [Chitinophagaceae bacterium]|nr:flagellar hook-basal body complex protein [Anaerolineae bacterium]